MRHKQVLIERLKVTPRSHSNPLVQDRERLAIISTMDVLLRTAIAKTRGRPLLIRVVRPTEFADERLLTTRAETVRALEREPVSQACRLAIRLLGEHLFEIMYSTRQMREIAEDAAALVPRQYGRRIAIIDHAWNGIGSEADRWLS